MAKCSSEKISGQSLARSVASLARSGEVDEVLANLARLVKRLVKSSWVVVYQVNPETGLFTPASRRSAGAVGEEVRPIAPAG